MSYINQYGQAIGPIKINSVWMLDTTIPSLQIANRKEEKYFSITQNKSDVETNLVPLLAATPPLGTYPSVDENGKTFYSLCAPRHAVATVEWVMAYASLKPGQLVGLDINQYATTNELMQLKEQVDTMDSRIVDQAEKINKNQQDININKSNISSNTARITTAEKNINENTGTINDMLDNPFPEGFILICGETSNQIN